MSRNETGTWVTSKRSSRGFRWTFLALSNLAMTSFRLAVHACWTFYTWTKKQSYPSNCLWYSESVLRIGLYSRWSDLWHQASILFVVCSKDSQLSPSSLIVLLQVCLALCYMRMHMFLLLHCDMSNEVIVLKWYEFRWIPIHLSRMFNSISLQRQREQVMAWAEDPSIRESRPFLCDTRRLIETQMVSLSPFSDLSSFSDPFLRDPFLHWLS